MNTPAVLTNKFITSAITVLLLFTGVLSYSQDYDIIVTVKGDSIACRIDSITDKYIYFEMKSQNIWAQTHIELTDVLEYRHDAVLRKEYRFKTGTSIIESRKPAIPTSVRDIQKNSVYIGILSLNYARMFPAGDHLGFTVGGGLYHMDATGIVGEASVIAGGVRHFFESGVMGVNFFGITPTPDPEDDRHFGGAVSVRMGYRYQSLGGLLLRGAPNFIFADGGFFVFCALSVGYSF